MFKKLKLQQNIPFYDKVQAARMTHEEIETSID